MLYSDSADLLSVVRVGLGPCQGWILVADHSVARQWRAAGARHNPHETCVAALIRRSIATRALEQLSQTREIGSDSQIRSSVDARMSKNPLMRPQPKILSKVITPFESKLGAGRPDLRRTTSTSSPVTSKPAGTDGGESLVSLFSARDAWGYMTTSLVVWFHV